MDTTENTTPTTETLRENRPRPDDGYRRLRSFQLATIIYDATVSFCDRLIDRSSRTHDRMVQAARSGRQYIAESSRAAAADSTTAVHLTNAARNSLDELLLDYEDFLRQRKLRTWPKDGSEAQAVRNVEIKHENSAALDPVAYAAWLEHKDPAVAANARICLIDQVDYLLARQATAREPSCNSQSCGSHQPAADRSSEKKVIKHLTDSSDTHAPACKLCGKPMALRTARTGKSAGRSFWGCTGYPECKGTLPGEKPV
ncbi:MAG: four helix bundle protein [Deltaproteobacteria bacterium]|nr:four helix bundle protein [Deltaproteobacteria bacterium]